MKKSEPENKSENEKPLSIWTICQNPSDYPNKFTARESLIGIGTITLTDNLIVKDTLDEIRQHMHGLTRIPRNPNDDSVIVEVWI